MRRSFGGFVGPQLCATRARGGRSLALEREQDAEEAAHRLIRPRPSPKNPALLKPPGDGLRFSYPPVRPAMPAGAGPGTGERLGGRPFGA